MVKELITHSGFPNSFRDPFIKTSPQTDNYNCIAHALGNNNDWYEPAVPKYLTFWPEGIPYEYTVEAYLKVFESDGYVICNNGDVEKGYNKIAFFYSADKNPESFHAAKLLPNGLWSSKLGSGIDVSHTIKAISNGDYGDVIQYLKRPE